MSDEHKPQGLLELVCELFNCTEEEAIHIFSQPFRPNWHYQPFLKRIDALFYPESSPSSHWINHYVSPHYINESTGAVGVTFEGIHSLTRTTIPYDRDPGVLSLHERNILLAGATDWTYDEQRQWVTGFWGQGPVKFELLNKDLGVFKNKGNVVGTRLYGIEHLVDERTTHA